MRRLGWAAALAGALAFASGALAAVPDAGPSFDVCVSARGGACSALPGGSLADAAGVAVSPDGESVFASAFGGDTVSSLGVGNGLRLRGCVAETDESGCETVPTGSLEGPAGVVVSPSGGDVYVASALGGTVARLARGVSGRLRFGSCVAAAALAGCQPAVAPSLRGATGLAFGPGGGDLYVASAAGAAVTRLVPTDSGELRPAGCLAYARRFGCHRLPKNSLAGADAVAVAPGGEAVYVAAFASAAVTELRRSPSGSLRYRGCIGDAGTTGCRSLPRGSLSGASGIAVSPDGADVFVVSQVGTVTRFRVTAQGRLTFAGCLADRALAGCAPVPGQVLAGATGIAVAPGGEDLYVTSQRADALVHLRVPARRSLAFAGCLSPGGAHGCRPVPSAALRDPYAVAASPNGRALYLTGARSATVAGFRLAARR
jgi:DNA-binding beta-propeller fold protein YncE